MKTVDIHELDSIIGGDSISGTVINAFTNVIKLLLDAGRSVGSAIRRVAEGNLCPLE
jgi:bacteriocin-like protein